MSNSRKKGKKAMMIAIYILLFTWIVLLALLIFIYMLRLQGYDTFAEWRNRNQAQEVLQPEVVSPQPTGSIRETPVPTPTSEATVTLAPTEHPELTETPTVVPTEAPAPTEAPLPTELPIEGTVFSGNRAVDSQIRAQAEDFFEEGEELCYITYETGIFFSVVFQRGAALLPLVYDLTTGEQVSGSDLIKETYFAIVKERLQTYVAEQFPEEAEDAFVSYEQTYQVEDYQKFYLTEDQLVFYFEENTLTDKHMAFSYGVELEEAKAFFYQDLEGNSMGPVIRDLDPEAKMIALTFDDGPHPKVEDSILKLLDEYDARATFFFLGQRIYDWYPNSPGKIYQAGHEVASHTYSHTVNFAQASAETMWSEINQTNLLIAAAAGYAPDYVRFPGGTDGKRTKEVPMIVVNWDVDSVDYAEKKKENGAEIIYKRLTNSSYLEDGSIVLLHSIYDNSYEAMVKFIPYLKEQGYELVTLSELFYYKGAELDTGIIYYNGYGATELPDR